MRNLLNLSYVFIGYLMGLFKLKCDPKPIWAALYSCDTKTITEEKWKDFDETYYTDWISKAPLNAITAYNEFYESKRWHEHGCFDPATGIIRDNRCIPWNSAYTKDTQPSQDDPGMCKI